MKIIDFQKEVRVFNIVGEVMFCISAQAPVLCKVIETRARHYPNGCVVFDELVAGHETYEVPRWFYGVDWWNDEFDNMTDSGQVGRSVKIAVPNIVYEAVQISPNAWSHGFVRSGQVVSAQSISQSEALSGVVLAPIAAYKINDRWIMIEESMIVAGSMESRINNPRQ